MNTVEFLASLESSATIGLDELNYDSVWHHSEAAQEMEQEGVVVHAIGWLDPQHIRAMFGVILGSGSNIVFEVMPFG